MTKHDDDLREMRRRWRKLGDDWNVYERITKLFAERPKQLRDYWQATYDLAKAYYEQFASDDEAPAGDDWLAALLQSLRSDDRVESISEVRQEGPIMYRIEAREVPNEPWGGPRCYFGPQETRGEVRRMLAQIGIEVRQ